MLIYVWDNEKDKNNIKKHGIAFKTATKVFEDPNRIEYFDESHSGDEDRYITIGIIDEVVAIITVVYTDRKDVIRIISARKATDEKVRDYVGSL